MLQHLRNQSVENVVIVGMMTNMCVDSTTRAAKNFGFLATLEFFFAKILTADEFMK